MKIATLEKIHELLKKEANIRKNERELTKNVYYQKKDEFEAIIIEAGIEAGDMKDESVVLAKRAVEEAKAVYDKARQQSCAAYDALHDFEEQEF